MMGHALRRSLCAGLAVMAMLLSAPAPAESILQRGNKDEPESLDPQKSDGLQEYWIQSDLFEGLTRIDPHGKVVPGVAESWDVSADGLTWTFHLRPDLHWSNGKELTAGDFVWSFQRAVNPATGAAYASILYPIAGARAINEGKEKDPATLGVTAPDPRTVVIHLASPTAYLGGLLTLAITFPLPRDIIETYGAAWTQPGHLVGNGAFTLDSWMPQAEIRLKRNPAYYDAASVKLDGVVWSVNKDDETALKRFRTGALDIARVPHKQVLEVKAEAPGQLHTAPELWTRYLSINTGRKPLDDARLRQALSLLIDRDSLNDKVDPHGQATGYAIVAPGIDGYTPQSPDWAGSSLDERRRRAAGLLEAAGYGPSNRLKLEIMYDAAEADIRRSLVAIGAMVKPYGIDVVLNGVEGQIVLTATRDHDYQVSSLEWIADYPDPWTFLSLFRSDAGGLNTFAYSNPDYDNLLDQASVSLDPAGRMALLQQGEALLARDVPAIPLSYDLWPRLVSARVTGYFDNALDQHASRDLGLAPQAGNL